MPVTTLSQIRMAWLSIPINSNYSHTLMLEGTDSLLTRQFMVIYGGNIYNSLYYSFFFTEMKKLPGAELDGAHLD